MMRPAVISRYPLYRDALATLVGTTFDQDQVAVFDCLKDAMAGAARDGVSMIVVDAEPGHVEEMDLSTVIAAIKPTPLVLFAALSPAETQAAYNAGARGCIPKTAPAL
jgi:DNA-binding NarL/FixJ family response regulator